MKQLLGLLVLSLGLGFGVGLIAQPVEIKAKDSDRGILTSEHLGVIKNRCSQAQSLMAQLHKSDQLLRVNQGQIYESISSKLMAPFNARAGLNKYDATELVTITGEFNNQFSDYRTIYKDYDLSLQKAIKVDCQNQPVAFYDNLTQARELRADVYAKSSEMIKSMDDYYQAFNDLIERGPNE